MNNVSSILGLVTINHSTLDDDDSSSNCSANNTSSEDPLGRAQSGTPEEDGAGGEELVTYSCRYQYNGERIKPLTRAQINRLRNTRERQLLNRNARRAFFILSGLRESPYCAQDGDMRGEETFWPSRTLVCAAAGAGWGWGGGNVWCLCCREKSSNSPKYVICSLAVVSHSHTAHTHLMFVYPPPLTHSFAHPASLTLNFITLTTLLC